MPTDQNQNPVCQKTGANRSPDENPLLKAIQRLTKSEAARRAVMYKIFNKKLWKQGGYKSFDHFVTSELSDSFSRSTARRLLNAARVDQVVGLKVGTIELRKTEEISKGKRPDKHIKQIWKIATKDLPAGEIPSFEQVKNAIAIFEQVGATLAFITTPEHHSHLIRKAPQKNREALQKTLRKMQELLEIETDG